MKFDDNFIKEEVRNDYKITSDMKKIRSIQLDILDKIKDICEKHNIVYFGVFGTMLGAIRHNGFIPWDDDIDLGMTRDNYEKFVKIAQKELPAEYYLQTSFTQRHYFSPICQIRYNNSTAISKWDFKKDMNKGVFVDIFVFDKLPLDDQKSEYKVRKKLENYRKFLFIQTINLRVNDSLFKGFIKKIISSLYIYLHGGFKNILKKYHSIAMTFNNLQDNYYYDYITYNGIQKTFFDSSIEDVFDCQFEYTTIKIPKNYKKFLISTYGENYMIPMHCPCDHSGIFLDVNTPYTYYETFTVKEFKRLFK